MIGDESRTMMERIDAVLCEIPVFGALVRDGSRDSVYELLMVAGPILLILIRILGRGLITRGLVFFYLLSFVVYLGYNYRRFKR